MIFVGNTLILDLEQRNPDTLEYFSLTSIEIQRKEFNSSEFAGVGYQRVLIQDNFGTIVNHGLGFNGQNTSLQISSNAFLLPLYRFDFAFNLDDFRLKQLYEIFLLAYSLRSSGEFVRIKLTDNRLYMSEPFTDDLTILRSGTTINIDNPIGYQLKQVEYLISLENFEWEYLIGNFYKTNIVGLEIEVEADSSQGTTCFNSTEEIIVFPNEIIGDGGTPNGGSDGQLVEGFDITEIDLPSYLLGSQEATNYGAGFKINPSSNDTYIGHFELDGDHYFTEWDPTSPGVNGEQNINYSDFSSRYKLDSGPLNTRVLSDKILFVDRDPDSTTHFFRAFLPDDTGVVSDTRETSQLPMVFYMTATNVDKYQFFLDEESTSGSVFLVPRDIRTTELTTFINSGGLVEHFDYGVNFGSFPYRPTFGYWGTKELNRRLFTNGNNPVQIGSSNVIIPALPGSPDETAIKITDAVADRVGSIWYGEKLNLATSVTVETTFELRMSDGTGADGIAFVVHDDSRGVTALGLGGGDLGYAGNLLPSGFDSAAAISPSLAIEFDNFGNDVNLDEPPGATTTPSYIRIVANGDKTGSTKLYEQVLTMDLRGSNARRITIEFNNFSNTVNFTIEDTASIEPTENYTATGINLASRIGTGEAYFGFTSATGGETDKHVIDRWVLSHSSNWKIELENGNEFRSELYDFNKSSNRINNTERTFMGTTNDTILSDVVTIKASNEGSTIYYHICYTPGNPNEAKVYKTNGPNVFQASKLLINDVNDGSIPLVDFGIDSPTGDNKFYLTQGSDSGNVYSTIDFINFTLIGSWDQENASRENEGQIYKFRNAYLVRSPSRFLLDCVNDVFVDMRELLLLVEQGTTEDDDIFGAGRKLVSCYATPRYDNEYTDNNEEQLVVCSNNVSNNQNLKCFKLQVV